MAQNPNSPLRSWLRRAPVPASIVVDGDPKKTIAVAADGGRARWRDVIETLAALNPKTISLHDEHGNFLRAKPWTDFEGDEEEDVDVRGELLKEKDFPIAALGEQFRLCIEHVAHEMRESNKEVVAALVDAVRAAGERAKEHAAAEVAAIKARSAAEIAAINAQAASQEENDEALDLLKMVAQQKAAQQNGAAKGGADG